MTPEETVKDYALIEWLKAQPGWYSYDGDASAQAALDTPFGLLRIGRTDDDVAAKVGLWVDRGYELKLK